MRVELMLLSGNRLGAIERLEGVRLHQNNCTCIVLVALHFVSMRSAGPNTNGHTDSQLKGDIRGVHSRRAVIMAIDTRVTCEYKILSRRLPDWEAW